MTLKLEDPLGLASVSDAEQIRANNRKVERWLAPSAVPPDLSAPAVQAMIESVSARGGGRVLLPPGLIMGTIVGRSNVRLCGPGMDLVTIRAAAADVSALSIPAGTVNFGIEGLTVDGNRASFGSGTSPALSATGPVTDLYMKDVKVTNGQHFSVFLNSP